MKTYRIDIDSILPLALTVFFSLSATYYTYYLVSSVQMPLTQSIGINLDATHLALDDVPPQNGKIYYRHSEPETNLVDDEEENSSLLLGDISVQSSAKPVNLDEVATEFNGSPVPVTNVLDLPETDIFFEEPYLEEVDEVEFSTAPVYEEQSQNENDLYTEDAIDSTETYELNSRVPPTKENVTLLAKIITAEAGSAPVEEKARVGIIPINRITTDYWEFSEIHTLEDALNQEWAYPTTRDRIYNGLQPNEESLWVAEQLLNGTIDVDFGDFTDDNLVFWQTLVIPTWNTRVVYQSEWHYYSILGR